MKPKDKEKMRELAQPFRKRGKDGQISDLLGSYTGLDEDMEAPVQDADDL